MSSDDLCAYLSPVIRKGIILGEVAEEPCDSLYPKTVLSKTFTNSRISSSVSLISIEEH
jgi:hypothetical protein